MHNSAYKVRAWICLNNKFEAHGEKHKDPDTIINLEEVQRCKNFWPSLDKMSSSSVKNANKIYVFLATWNVFHVVFTTKM